MLLLQLCAVRVNPARVMRLAVELICTLLNCLVNMLNYKTKERALNYIYMLRAISTTASALSPLYPPRCSRGAMRSYWRSGVHVVRMQSADSAINAFAAARTLVDGDALSKAAD